MAPAVSPDRIEDAPAIKPDPYPDFDTFSWRAFIALNWPSLTDPAHRGEPDRAKRLGDPGPRVWETFKARYELFQVGSDGRPIAPKPWANLRSGEPLRNGCRQSRKDARDLHALHGFQPVRLRARNRAQIRWWRRTGAYTRYEARINEAEYDALAAHGWSLGQTLPDPAAG